ncbi:MAG: recombinase RecQ [Flavobacteriales bacterium]|nr:recombinase RecQ [Flavobacteriales bacterium]|tara:strand:- start:3786 stop:5666 length:1881 start_codon:yes stop_codon:yes gene_type:complete
MNSPEFILDKYWGFTSFRSAQKIVIQQALSGNDVLALLPTGAGKSICFQVPALCKDGICIVISPLIALMNDQVGQLKHRGIKAEFISTGMSPKQIDYVLDNCIYGETKFLYLSPERLNSIFVKERLKLMNINFIAVDEAHCISQWGHDFRPAYRSVMQIRDWAPKASMIAVTATATKKVSNDIQLQLNFNKQNVIKTSFERKNIFFESHHTENKIPSLIHYVKDLTGSGIIYIRSRKISEEISRQLNLKDISSEYYHAGLPIQERKNIEDRWKKNSTQIIVATNAFGMGIDKSDVRFVVHFGLPNSLEEYYQEAGRAGRDGKPSKAALFFNKNDIQNLQNLLQYRFPKRNIIREVYQAIGNNAQVAIGAGENTGTAIDMRKFSKKLELHALIVHYAVKILENAGYIFISEDMTSSSKLKILQDRKEIEGILSNTGFQSQLLSTILRSYTGLFNSYIKISEGKIAEILKTSISKVKKGLDIFERTHVVDYERQNFLPRIFFSVNRISSRDLIIPKEILELRYEVAKNQLDALTKFAIEKKKCRTNIALFYFDELPKTKCNNCDCCEKDISSLNEEHYILQLIKSNPLELAELVSISNLPRAKTISEIRRLLDSNKIVRDGMILREKC